MMTKIIEQRKLAWEEFELALENEEDELILDGFYQSYLELKQQESVLFVSNQCYSH